MAMDRESGTAGPGEPRSDGATVSGRATPSRLHFCWIGPDFGWSQAFAVLSAAGRSGLDEIILHHTHALDAVDTVAALEGAPDVRLSRIDPASYLADAGRMLGIGGQLAALYGAVEAAAVKADILRAAILWREGGLYLDMDTVTVAPLTPLLGMGAFLASESIVWPAHIRTSASPLVRARSIALDLLRKLLRRLPNGWSSFRRVESLYHRSVTNSAMGSPAGDLFFADYLHAMVRLSPEKRQLRCALGPHLLQLLAQDPVEAGVAILEPHVFHPFPPEISSHWFRSRRRVELGEILPASTLAVHWYASVRTRVAISEVTPESVALNRDRQFYSALVWANTGPAGAQSAPRRSSNSALAGVTLLLCASLPFHAAKAAVAGAVPCDRAAPQNGPVLHVVASGARSDAGNVTFTLYGDDPAVFLKARGSIAIARMALKDRSAEACFTVAAPGIFAVAIYHDENNNHHFDRNVFGLPAERYGFSNNPTLLLGPPSFGAVSFPVKQGENRIAVRLD